MKLVEGSLEFHINMDYITFLTFDGKDYWANVLNKGKLRISKEAYENILKYGKAN